MYVGGVKSSVYGFYTTLHIEYCYPFVTHVEGVKGVKYYVLYSVYRASCPSKGERLFVIWNAFYLLGLAVHHQSVRGGSFVNFLGLVNYKGDCRQIAQPIPNS